MSIFERLQGAALFLLFVGLCLLIGRSAIEDSRAATVTPDSFSIEQDSNTPDDSVEVDPNRVDRSSAAGNRKESL